MEDVESMGLLKMDFLGLKNLTMIEKTIDLVEESVGKRIDPDSISFDDSEQDASKKNDINIKKFFIVFIL